jgi:hypothetical protein
MLQMKHDIDNLHGYNKVNSEENDGVSSNLRHTVCGCLQFEGSKIDEGAE